MVTPKAFVIMPFRRPYDGYFTHIYSAALSDAGFIATKADDLFAPRPIVDDIRAKIMEAELLLCEMSGRNPNVFYELGLAHAVGKPAILLSNSKKDIPFDLQHVRAIVYDTKYAGWEDKLRQAIASAAREVSASTVTWPPPLIPEIINTPNQGIPGVERVFPNLPSCEQEILDELSKSRTVRIFLQLGKTVLVGTPNIYEYLEKSIKSGSTVKVLHAGIESRYLTRRVAHERGSSYDKWLADIEYASKKLQNLRRRSVGVVQSRTHDEAYYWLIFLFDRTAYAQPYIYERSNTQNAPVLKLRVDSGDDTEKSLYRVFDRYFDRKWDESVSSIKCVEDLFYLGELETKSLAVAGVVLYNGLYLFVIPKRYIQELPDRVQFHAVGGKIADGEAPHVALVREIQEEIDCLATVVHSDSTQVMSSHSDIGAICLQDNPAPSHVYKRTRLDSSVQYHSVVWLLGYQVILSTNAMPQPKGEIAAILLLSKELLQESISRRLKLREVLSSKDGSTVIFSDGVLMDAEAIITPSGLASIIAAASYSEIDP